MNEYIFYTTEGTTFAPKSEAEIENCQVLGVVQAENVEEAKVSLLKENAWIKESGFDIERSQIKQVLTGEQRDDIECVLNFLRAGSGSLCDNPGCGQSRISKAIGNLERLRVGGISGQKVQMHIDRE